MYHLRYTLPSGRHSRREPFVASEMYPLIKQCLLASTPPKQVGRTSRQRFRRYITLVERLATSASAVGIGIPNLKPLALQTVIKIDLAAFHIFDACVVH